MEIGIVGPPLSGKTTLFNLLTRQHADTGFAGGKKATNLGTSRVPDARVDRLAEIWKPKKTTHTTIHYVDVAGVEKGAGKTGLSAEVLGHLKTTDALLAVVRGFENDEVPHPDGSIDPLRDLRALEEELLLSDHVIVESRLERLQKQMKGKGKVEKEHEVEKALLERCRAALEDGRPLRALDLPEDDRKRLRGFQFLTLKPVVVVLNVSEDAVAQAKDRLPVLREAVAGAEVAATFLCATIEQEISELPDEDARAFLEDLGLAESATDRIIRSSYELLGLISFFTMGEDECRAWTIRRGTRAPEAAGTIHSDLERGFIRAEVVRYDDFVAAGSLPACRDKGLLKVEGKDYVVADGDILNIRFSV